MTPEERASRLFDRIMRLATEGKQDSVSLFASMAIPVYESLGPLNADQRYDFGRVAEVSGNLDIAAAQADSILKPSPTHLLGLILAARVADMKGNQSARSAFEKRFLAAQAAELAKNLPEYALHRTDIEAAAAAANSGKR